MRLYYKGKYSGNPDELPYLEHEPGAVQRLFQSLCKLIIADIRYVNSSVPVNRFDENQPHLHCNADFVHVKKGVPSGAARPRSPCGNACFRQPESGCPKTGI